MKPAHSTDQNKGRYETGETIQEKVKLYSADWIWFQWLSPCPIFISRIQNRVSVQKQAGRKYIEELVKRPMPFIAKYKTRGTASENISTANHIIPQKKLYSSLLSVHVDYIF